MALEPESAPSRLNAPSLVLLLRRLTAERTQPLPSVDPRVRDFKIAQGLGRLRRPPEQQNGMALRHATSTRLMHAMASGLPANATLLFGDRTPPSHVTRVGSHTQAASDSRLESKSGTMAANYTNPENDRLRVGRALPSVIPVLVMTPMVAVLAAPAAIIVALAAAGATSIVVITLAAPAAIIVALAAAGATSVIVIALAAPAAIIVTLAAAGSTSIVVITLAATAVVFAATAVILIVVVFGVWRMGGRGGRGGREVHLVVLALVVDCSGGCCRCGGGCRLRVLAVVLTLLAVVVQSGLDLAGKLRCASVLAPRELSTLQFHPRAKHVAHELLVHTPIVRHIIVTHVIVTFAPAVATAVIVVTFAPAVATSVIVVTFAATSAATAVIVVTFAATSAAAAVIVVTFAAAATAIIVTFATTATAIIVIAFAATSAAIVVTFAAAAPASTRAPARFPRPARAPATPARLPRPARAHDLGAVGSAVLEKAYCFRLFQIRSANTGLAVARNRMDQLRSVGFTAVQTLAPILDELAGANDVAQQGAVAHVGLVVQVGVPILIDSGHLWPIFWVRGADVLGAVQQKTLLEGGLFGVPWVGHALEPHSLPSAKVCRIQVREIKSGFVPSFQAGLLHRLSRP